MKSYKRWTNRYSHRLTKSIDELISNRQNELDNMSDEDIEFQYVKTLAQNQVDKLTSKNKIEELVNSLKEAKNYDFIKGRFDRWNSDHNYKLEINPELIKYNLVDYWLGMEDLTSSVGTIINHPFKNFKLDGNIGEMCRFQQHQNSSRRMISSTNILLMINWLRRFILDETISIQLIYMFRNLVKNTNIEHRCLVNQTCR